MSGLQLRESLYTGETNVLACQVSNRHYGISVLQQNSSLACIISYLIPLSADPLITTTHRHCTTSKMHAYSIIAIALAAIASAQSTSFDLEGSLLQALTTLPGLDPTTISSAVAAV